MSSVIYFIRHGELDNPKQVFYGRKIDLSLSRAGRRHVKKLAEFLHQEGVKPSLIFSSPLTRALQTAQILAEVFRPLEIKPDDRLLETEDKNLAGRPASLTNGWGDLYHKADPDYEIEAPEHQARRVNDCVKDILNQFIGQTVFLISHGDPLAFGMFSLLHPDQKIPSVNSLYGSRFLERGEAWRVTFSDSGQAQECLLISV